MPRFSIPVSRTYGEQMTRIVDALSSSRMARTLPPSPPLHSSLEALAGSDVLLVFLESYGSVTYDRPEFQRALQPARERLAAALSDTGRGVVSGFVSSPTFGGESVLAHLSLLSGIEVRDSTRYALLMTQKRPTLVSRVQERRLSDRGRHAGDAAGLARRRVLRLRRHLRFAQARLSGTGIRLVAHS